MRVTINNVSNHWRNVRLLPSLRGRVVATYPFSTKQMSILGRVSNSDGYDWILVSSDEVTGWVAYRNVYTDEYYLRTLMTGVIPPFGDELPMYYRANLPFYLVQNSVAFTGDKYRDAIASVETALPIMNIVPYMGVGWSEETSWQLPYAVKSVRFERQHVLTFTDDMSVVFQWVKILADDNRTEYLLLAMQDSRKFGGSYQTTEPFYHPDTMVYGNQYGALVKQDEYDRYDESINSIAFGRA